MHNNLLTWNQYIWNIASKTLKSSPCPSMTFFLSFFVSLTWEVQKKIWYKKLAERIVNKPLVSNAGSLRLEIYKQKNTKPRLSRFYKLYNLWQTKTTQQGTLNRTTTYEGKR